jgi:hypothetical protein
LGGQPGEGVLQVRVDVVPIKPGGVDQLITAAARLPARRFPANSQLRLLWTCFHNCKNWLHSDTVGGASASANIYSLIETCKANQVDPHRYLIALFTALPLAPSAEDYEALLPWRLKAG